MNHKTHSVKLIEEMNRYYDARAPWHDEFMSYKSHESMEKLLDPVIKTIEPWISDKDVIEVACGTGNWTQVLADRANMVTAIDVSSNALDIAADKVSDFKNVFLRQADAYQLDKIAGSYDVLFAADWWSHIPKEVIGRFLDSVARKLNAGGRAIFLDIVLLEEFRKEPSYIDSYNNRVSQRELPDGSTYDVVKNFPTESEIREILSGYSQQIDYYEFDSLRRYMVVFETK